MCSKAKPSVCKCPASENAPDDPSSQDDVPDSPDDIDGDQPNHMTCAMYMGGVGTGRSWFDTTAQPSDSPTCNVFGARDSCCSSDWVQNNVDDDLYSLTDLISPDNTGCYDAIEALRCIVCSPYQSNFMSKKEDQGWNMDICLSTSMSTYRFCKSEIPTLFPDNAASIVDASTMVTALTTRILGGDPDDPSSQDNQPTVNPISLAYGIGGAPGLDHCYLHDTMSPLLLNVVICHSCKGGPTLNFVFNEPLSTVPVGMHISADVANTDTAPAPRPASADSPLISIVKCKSKLCMVKNSNTNENSFDGDVIWSTNALTEESYGTTKTLTDTLHVQQKGRCRKPGTKEILRTTVYLSGYDCLREHQRLQTNNKEDFGYAVWLSQNAVFDRAGNSFAGSDMDAAMIVHVETSNPFLWGVWITVGLAVLGLVGFGVYAYTKKKNNEDICGCCSRQAGSDGGPGYSSGGFVNLGDA